METISDTIIDQYGRPVAGATVTIRNAVGGLVSLTAGNPLVTDSTGRWTCELDGGSYSLVATKAGVSVSRSFTVCGASVSYPYGTGNFTILDSEILVALDPIIINAI